MNGADGVFSIARVRRTPNRLTLLVTGVVDIVTAPVLLRALAGESATHVEVDISAVELLCAAGIGVLSTSALRLGRAGGSLRITGASSLARRCLLITGAEHLLEPHR